MIGAAEPPILGGSEKTNPTELGPIKGHLTMQIFFGKIPTFLKHAALNRGVSFSTVNLGAGACPGP